MSTRRRTFKRKRGDDSSDDEADMNISTIQLSPVASIVSFEGSDCSDEATNAAHQPENDLNATQLSLAEAEVSAANLPEVFSFCESFMEEQTSQPSEEHEHFDETAQNIINLNVTGNSIPEQDIPKSPSPVECLYDVEIDSSSSDESSLASEDLFQESDSDISFSEEELDFKSLQDLPIYKDAPISINDSMVATLCFVIRHDLDGEEIDDLLQLINIHCKSEFNRMKTSLYFFKKYFSCLDAPIKKHYYCSACYAKLTKEEGKISKCPNAQLHPATSGYSIFVELPLIPQLLDIFSQKGFESKLKHKYTRRKECEGNLEDIYDGQLYKELEAAGFLSPEKPFNFTMIMNADGVPVFKSTNKSLWPMYFNINELPPRERFKKENTVIGGLWFGGKPHANLMLDPLLKTFRTIKKGFEVQLADSDISVTAKGVLLAATTDIPAKIMLTGMASYSGAFGCQICKVKGGSVEIIKKRTNKKKKTETIVKKSSVWVFRYSEALDLRSHSETIQLGKRAHEILLETANPKTNVSGVKFPSAIFKIMYDGIRGFAIDDLHTLYLGVTKTLINLLFDSKHSTEPFSLRQYLPLVDQRLMNVKLPNFLQRGIKKIETDLAFWKGTEFQTFVHYLSIPVLEGIMPDKYLEHHIDLVSSLHVLQSLSISPDALLSCEKKLDIYVKNFELLYGTRYMSMVFHLLRHLAYVVNNLGTMRYASCYPYEDLNGIILKMIHGTRYVDTQLASGCFLIKQLQKAVESVSSEQVKDFCFRLLHPSLRSKKLEDIDFETFSVGTYKLLSSPKQHINDSLNRVGINEAKIESFLRLRRGELQFVSRTYTRCDSRNSSVCSFVSENHVKHGTIDIFLKVTMKSENTDQNVAFFAIIQLASLSPYVIGRKEVPHMSRYSITDEYCAVPVTDLKDMLVFVEVEENAFVCQPLY